MNKSFASLNQFKRICVLVQALLSFFVIVFAIITFNVEWFLIITQIVLLLLLMVLTFNNITIYKRKGFTIIYIIAVIVMIVDILFVK